MKLERHELFKNQQFGFRKGKSCNLQLLSCLNKWSKALDDKDSIDIAYIDFKKAFDSVSHLKLLSKLKSFGINKFLFSWIRAFLFGQTQSVKVNSVVSNSVQVTSGVPQGSVLGPTLFLIFINDLVDVIQHSEILLFADDLKIFNSSSNYILLQSDLNNLALWSERWQLPISLTKSNILYIGNSNPKHTYFLNNFRLDNVGYSCKDLGVYLTTDLSSRVHCSNIVSKASRISNMIHRCFISKNVNLKVKAFKVYVRPILEYCSSVWNPHLISDIQNVEKVQRRFTKRLFRGSMSYGDRLKTLNLDSLELRRLYADAYIIFQIVNNNLLDFQDFYSRPPPSNTRSANQSMLYVPRFRLDCRKYDFAVRSVKIWNFIPLDSKNLPFLAFKKALKKLDFTGFLKGRM